MSSKELLYKIIRNNSSLITENLKVTFSIDPLSATNVPRLSEMNSLDRNAVGLCENGEDKVVICRKQTRRRKINKKRKGNTKVSFCKKESENNKFRTGNRLLGQKLTKLQNMLKRRQKVDN